MKTHIKNLSLLLLLCFVISSSSSAQFGIKGGLTFANQKWSSSGVSLNFDSKIGFHFGFFGDIPIGSKIFFEPGLIYTQKGFKMSSSLTQGQGEVSVTLNYLDIPLNLIYKIETNGSLKINLSTGPVICYGLSGTGESSQGDGDIHFGSGTDDDYKALDFNWGIGGGIEVSNIQIGLSYNFGLSNISNIDGITTKNNVFNISIGILLGKKK